MRWLSLTAALASGLLLALACAGEASSGQPLDSVEVVELPGIDLEETVAEELRRHAEGLPSRFAIPQPVSLRPSDQGTWEALDDSELRWRLRLRSPGALSLSIGFTTFHLPPGARLEVLSPDGERRLGPFTDRDNEPHRQLWTPVIPGEEVVVELQVPSAAVGALDLEIGSVNHGYVPFGPLPESRSESCNLDVVCDASDGFPQVDPWRDQIRSVGVYTLNGSWHCTGSLLNNTSADLTPYFLTANHCGVTAANAPTMVVYWNYQSSTCRPPGSPASGGPGDGTLDQFSTGALLRASSATSDYALVELDDLPDPAFDLYWSGWNRTVADATSAATIHHPLAEEKRINFEYHPTQTSSNGGTTVPGDGTHVWVTNWDVGSLQIGSSGAPLYDQDRRVVGQLHSTSATCTNGGSTWAGRLSMSWEGDGTSSTRLRDWLDSGSTGVTTLDGLNNCVRPSFDFTVNPNPAVPGQPVSFSVADLTGSGPFNFAWDLDDDGVTDCTAASCVHTYPGYYNRDATLTVTDGLHCMASVTRAVLVNAPFVVYASTGSPIKLCGDTDNRVEPGEEWSVPVRVENVGTVTAAGAAALIRVRGTAPTVALTHGELAWGEIPPGEQRSQTFAFLIDPTFTPCGERLVFDLGPISWVGGAAPGRDEVFAAVTGGQGGTVTRYQEFFDNAATWGGDNYPDDDKWSVTFGPGPHTCGGWQRVGDGAGHFRAEVLGIEGCLTSSVLTSPTIDLSSTAPTSLALELFLLFVPFGDEHGLINVYDGSSWHTVANYSGAVVGNIDPIDITSFALGNPTFRVQFSFQNAAGGGGFVVDNVKVTAPLPLCDNLVDCGRVPTIFADGFESGLTAAWSTTLP